MLDVRSYERERLTSHVYPETLMAGDCQKYGHRGYGKNAQNRLTADQYSCSGDVLTGKIIETFAKRVKLRRQSSAALRGPNAAPGQHVGDRNLVIGCVPRRTWAGMRRGMQPRRRRRGLRRLGMNSGVGAVPANCADVAARSVSLRDPPRSKVECMSMAWWMYIHRKARG